MDDDELSEALIILDHRSGEDEIVGCVAAVIESAHSLDYEEIDSDDEFEIVVTFAEARRVIPLTMSPHDRYVMISSLAWLLRDAYTFFVRSGYAGCDTHELLVVANEQAALLRSEHRQWLDQNFVELELGLDYFHDRLPIPYLDHEDNAPDFESNRNEIASAKDELKTLISGLFSGKLPEQYRGDPELEQASREMQQNMQKLRSDIAAIGMKKPWWKFW